MVVVDAGGALCGCNKAAGERSVTAAAAAATCTVRRKLLGVLKPLLPVGQQLQLLLKLRLRRLLLCWLLLLWRRLCRRSRAHCLRLLNGLQWRSRGRQGPQLPRGRADARLDAR